MGACKSAPAYLNIRMILNSLSIEKEETLQMCEDSYLVSLGQNLLLPLILPPMTEFPALLHPGPSPGHVEGFYLPGLRWR